MDLINGLPYMNETIIVREPNSSDEVEFLEAMSRSEKMHHHWVKSPITHQEFQEYIKRSRQPNQRSYLALTENSNIIGVFNISEIVYGFLQSAYLGFYGVVNYSGKGYMSSGLKLVLKKVFTELKLHRLEANIQPQNINSLNLVQANGFRKEGYSPRYLQINSEWQDHERWAITYEDWSNIQGYDLQ